MRWSTCLLLLLATGAWAHEDDEPAPDGGLVPAWQTTVRGARPARSASEVTVEREVLDAAPRSSAIDLLRLAPGVVATQHSGEGKAAQLFLRGFDAVHGQDVELSVAGLPVNEVSHIHGLGYADLTWLIPEVVRQVKVTPGSPRAAQGDFAVAGTVRYELGLEEDGVVGALGFGSFGRQRLFAGFRPKGTPGGFAAVEYVRGDGFGPRRGFERLSSLAQLGGQDGVVRYRAVLGAAASRFESPGVLRADTLASGGDFFAATGAGQGGESSRYQGLVGVERPLAGGRSTVEVFGVLVDLSLRNNFTGFLGSRGGDGLLQQQRTGSLGVRALHQAPLHVGGEHLHLELGLQARHDAVLQSQQAYAEADGGLARPAVDAAIGQTLASAWTELAWAPGAWRFMLGGRFDLLAVEVLDVARGDAAPRRAFGPHLGLKAAIERQLGDHLRVLASYGDGFRTPQARQLSDGEGAPFVSARGGELGLRFESERLSANVAGFATSVAQDFFFDHLLGTTRFVGPTLRVGASALVTARPLEGVLASLAVTGVSARRLERDEPLPYVTPLVGRLDASWSRRFEGLGEPVTPRLGLGVTALGPRPLPFAEWSAPVLLVDARVGARVGPIELALDVQNLLDARWRDGEYVFASRWDPSPTASLVPGRHFSAGAPRTLFLTLELHR